LPLQLVHKYSVNVPECDYVQFSQHHAAPRPTVSAEEKQAHVPSNLG
jgi:hypothetical protein